MSAADRLAGPGLSLREALRPEALRDVLRELDDIEGAVLWCPEFAIRDSFAQLAFAAAHTTRLRLATGIVPMAARTPASTALAAATVDELSQGRMVLGLGVGHPSMTEDWHGQRHPSALRWARDYVTVVQQALSGRATSWEGPEASSTGFRLLTGGAPDVPVVLAALGPKMLALAAEVADGVLLNWTTPASAGASIATLREGAAAAQRAPVPVAAYVRVAAGPDPARQAYEHTAFYAGLPAYRAALERMGFGGSGDLAREAAAELVLHGAPDDIAARARQWREAGVDSVVVYPVGDEESIAEALSLAVDVVGRLSEPVPSGTPEASSEVARDS